MLTSHRQNSFDALRLFAAWLVILGHGFILSGSTERLPLWGGIDVSVLGVAIFFTISGYLIWKSWASATTWHDFVAARALRIFPALILVVFVTVAILGPLVTSVGAGAYFGDFSTYKYLLNSFIFDPQYTLPGVFLNLPVTDAVNGSLWTLRAELLCYIAVPLAAFFPRLFQPYLLFASGFALIYFGLGTNTLLFGTNVSVASLYWGFFAMGSGLAAVNFRNKLTFVIPFTSIILWLLATSSSNIFLQVMGMCSLAVAIISVGLLNIPVIRDTARFGDFSYGMYLVAFPVQQTLLLLLPGRSPWLYVGIVTAISLVIAWGIWHLVEARALSQKRNLSTWLRRLTSSPL